MFWPGFDLFPVGPVPCRAVIAVFSCDAVVDDLGVGVGLCLPGSFRGGGGIPPPVRFVAGLQVLPLDPVFFVVPCFCGLFGLLVPFAGLLVVGGLWYRGDAREFGV